MLKLTTKLDFLITKTIFTFSNQSPMIDPSTRAYTKSIYEKGIYMQSSEPQPEHTQVPKRQQRKRPVSEKKADKKGKDNDDQNRGGGLLEPIIEDWKEWVARRRPQPHALA